MFEIPDDLERTSSVALRKWPPFVLTTNTSDCASRGEIYHDSMLSRVPYD